MKHNAFSYIRKLRNADKRLYAWEYYNWLTRDQAHEEQEPPSRCNLCCMAAQAVRMNLDEMMKSEVQS